jgi:hypothetical protein
VYEKFGTPEWIRTTDLLLRRQTLYPAELRAHKLLQLNCSLVGRGGQYGTMQVQTDSSRGEVPEWSNGAVC